MALKPYKLCVKLYNDQNHSNYKHMLVGYLIGICFGFVAAGGIAFVCDGAGQWARLFSNFPLKSANGHAKQCVMLTKLFGLNCAT